MMTPHAYDLLFPCHETLKSLLRKQKLAFGTVCEPMEDIEDYNFQPWHFDYQNEKIIHKFENFLIFIHPKVSNSSLPHVGCSE